MALVAIALVTLAPTVSRSLAAFALPALGSWCEPAPAGRLAPAGMEDMHGMPGMQPMAGMDVMPGMEGMPGMVGMHGMQAMPGMAGHGSLHGTAQPGEHPGMPGMDMDAACGYCTLFAQLPALGGVWHVAALLPTPARAVAPVPLPGLAPVVARRFAPPRGPPAGSNA